MFKQQLYNPYSCWFKPLPLYLCCLNFHLNKAHSINLKLRQLIFRFAHSSFVFVLNKEFLYKSFTDGSTTARQKKPASNRYLKQKVLIILIEWKAYDRFLTHNSCPCNRIIFTSSLQVVQIIL